MSRAEIAYELVATKTVQKIVIPEIQRFARRIEGLAEQMLNAENPEINKQRLEEITDACAAIRQFAGKL